MKIGKYSEQLALNTQEESGLNVFIQDERMKTNTELTEKDFGDSWRQHDESQLIVGGHTDANTMKRTVLH